MLLNTEWGLRVCQISPEKKRYDGVSFNVVSITSGV